MRFRDRHQAGALLARALVPYLESPAIVYALPRGGVPVAAEVARRFKLPLDLVIARKIGHPWRPEYAIGAVTETGTAVFNEEERASLDPAWVEKTVAAERAEARRRRERYRAGRERTSAAGRCAILVDDGIATGLTLRAAVAEVRADRPARLIVAVPVAPRETARDFAGLADRFVAVLVPDEFMGAVGAYYEDFRQIGDQEVIEELARCARNAVAARAGARGKP
ncbi:MAG: phosphoribosyl transferase [Nevskia sp.]|nr:phosphoribosyl transferase [Nevskia sp.]